MMKKTKKGFKSLAILLALVLAIGFSPATNVSAKTAPRLNYKKVTIVQGKKKRLKVKGTKRKVKWSSTKKSVVTVNKKGVIKAKKKGKATIIAKVGKKKLRCKVTVKKKPAKKKSSKKTSTSVKKQLPADSWYVNFGFSDEIGVNKTFDLFRELTAGGEDLANTSYSIRSKYFKWYSSNTSVLKINQYGIATGKSKGKSKVYCKYMTRSGKWVNTKSATITVKDVGDVKISYTTSSSTGDKNLFDTVTCTVKNNSSSAIEFNRRIYVETGSWYHFKNSTDKRVRLNPGESATIVYKPYAYLDKIWNTEVPYTDVLDIRNVWSIEFPFVYNGNWVTMIHHIRGGEYWSTK